MPKGTGCTRRKNKTRLTEGRSLSFPRKEWGGKELAMKRLILVLTAACLLAGCTDAEWRKATKYGAKYRVTVWSGGVAVKTYTSTGAVETQNHGSEWYFKDSATNALVMVGGTVTVEELAN